MGLNLSTISKNLLAWYSQNHRELPWRQANDPYSIWISEVMLQQTTVRAVIPYYERFMAHFPDLHSLARASESQVLGLWAGLGYYSRARNLHRAAIELNKLDYFPRNYSELIKYPGFGPYTARAVTSIAFGEPVGVVDGNVIRVLSRLFNRNWKWWLPQVREELQTIADKLAQSGPSGDLNQSLMDLGAQICTPRSPTCVACPLLTNCLAQKHDTAATLPHTRPRKEKQIWILRMDIIQQRGKILVEPNEIAPFLRGTLLPPALARRVQTRPKTFDFRHAITHYDIYVQIRHKPLAKKQAQQKWITIRKLDGKIQSSLVRKALQQKKF